MRKNSILSYGILFILFLTSFLHKLSYAENVFSSTINGDASEAQRLGVLVGKICKKYEDPGRIQSSGLEFIKRKYDGLKMSFVLKKPPTGISLCVPRGILDLPKSERIERDFKSTYRMVLVLHPFVRLALIYSEMTRPNNITSFKEFVQIILKNPLEHRLTNTEKSIHSITRQYHRDCPVCRKDSSPNLVLRIDDENYKENLEHVIEEYGVKEEDASNPVADYLTKETSIPSDDYLRASYSQLSEEELTQLADLYYVDFDTYGYSPSRYYQYVIS